ncbi:MAG: ATP-binding protein [Deltaproteobacteria bacterium]|nr:ATP-binding protein [Deltaproteobacteria bacterium]
MVFVGREKETRQIIRALGKDSNVIITGKFGMGRTKLIRHVSDVCGKRWRFVFVDFSKTPGQVCTDILTELSPGIRFINKDQCRRYKTIRHRIATVQNQDARPMVLVLDNIGKLTPQRLALIRYLSWEKRFLFIAVTERFLREDDFFLLRAELQPEHVIKLGRISRRDSIAYFHAASERNGFQWELERIRMMAETAGGYPLSMREMVTREKTA